MPVRNFDSGYWGKPNTRKLSKDAISVNAFVFTHDCLPSGLYYIDTSTIAFFTKIPEENISDLLEEIETKTGRIKWWSDEGLIWVKNFIYRNKKSDTWLLSVANALKQISNQEAVQELITYYLAEYPDIGRRLAELYGVSADKYEPTLKDEIDIDGLLDKKLKEFCQFYKEKKLGVVTTSIKDAIQGVCKDFSFEWFKAAYEEAALTIPKPNLKYMKAIMERWKRDGLGEKKEAVPIKVEPNPGAMKIWGKALEELGKQVTRSYYRTWLEKTVGVSYEDAQFTVGCPNAFVAEYLNQNQRSLIEKTLIGFTQPEIEVVFGVMK